MSGHGLKRKTTSGSSYKAKSLLSYHPNYKCLGRMMECSFYFFYTVRIESVWPKAQVYIYVINMAKNIV